MEYFEMNEISENLSYNNKEGVFEFLDICKINHTLRNRNDDQRLSQTGLGFRNVNLVSQVNANRSASS